MERNLPKLITEFISRLHHQIQRPRKYKMYNQMRNMKMIKNSILKEYRRIMKFRWKCNIIIQDRSCVALKWSKNYDLKPQPTHYIPPQVFWKCRCMMFVMGQSGTLCHQFVYQTVKQTLQVGIMNLTAAGLLRLGMMPPPLHHPNDPEHRQNSANLLPLYHQ